VSYVYFYYTRVIIEIKELNVLWVKSGLTKVLDHGFGLIGVGNKN